MPQGGWQQPQARPGGEANTPGIVGLILGILGILTTLFTLGFLGFIGLLLGIPAIILGVMGRRKADRGESGQRGIATGGLITGIIATVLGLLAVVALIVGLAFLGSTTPSDFQ